MFSLLLILISQVPALSDTFSLANNLYNQGKYDEALGKYEYVLSKDVKNHILYYDIGNCYFKLGKTGYAILFYKRAQKLKPGDADINFNLNFARARRTDELKNSELPGIIKNLVNLLKSPDINILVIITSVLYFVLVAVICLSLFRMEIFIKRLRLGLSILFVIVLAIFLSNLGELNKKEAVLLEATAELRSGPSDENTLICAIHEGMEMKVLSSGSGEGTDWLKVVLPNGVMGWVKTNQVGRI